MGDELRILAEEPAHLSSKRTADSLDYISSFRILAANIPSIIITDAAIVPADETTVPTERPSIYLPIIMR